MTDPYARTYVSDPNLWDDDPSYLVKVEAADQKQVVYASGWHRRQAEFEYRGLAFDEVTGGIAIGEADVRPPSVVEMLPRAKRFEIEFALRHHDEDEVAAILASFIDTATANSMVDSMKKLNRRVSAARQSAEVFLSSGHNVEYVDLLCQNLPARSVGSAEPLRILARWCRIFLFPKGTVTLYEPLGPSELKELRWPHNCIWIGRGKNYYLEPSRVGCLADAVAGAVQYEEYNLENWRVEYVVWEDQLMQIMVDGDDRAASSRLLSAQTEMGRLSRFVATAALSVRNLERRIDLSSAVAQDTEVCDLITSKAAIQRALLQAARLDLRQGAKLLSSVAQTVQAYANTTQAEAAERASYVLAGASAVFIVPSVVIAFFSMSIVNPDTPGQPWSAGVVLALCGGWMIISVIVLIGLRRALHKKRR